MNIKNVIKEEVNEMPEEDYFPEIEKLNQLAEESGIQTQLTKDSPFFFEEMVEEPLPTRKFNIGDWILLHKIESVGFVVLVIGAVAVFTLT